MTVAPVDELTKHKQAYLQLFRSVLAKRPMDAAAKEQLIGKLSGHMDSVIKGPEDLIPRIPEFAGMLGVNAQALSTFIGTNFLQALSNVSKQPPPSSAPAAPAPGEKKKGSFLIEIIHFCPPLLPPGAKFATADTGFIKLITPQGEVQCQSFLQSGDSGGQVEISLDTAAEPEASPVPSAPGAPAAPKVVAQPRPAGAEKSILKEILERFGNQLDIPGKLEVRDLAEDEPVDIYPDEEGAEEDAPQAEAKPVTPGQAAPPQAARREVSILKDILERFGNQLDIPSKLVPRDYMSDTGEDDDDDVEEDDEMPEDAQSEASSFVEAIAFGFSEYLDVLKKLQEFQTSGDQAGYKQWMGQVKNESRALIALRNIEKREKAAPVDWENEYSTLAPRVSMSGSKLANLHHHFKKLGRVHQIWGSLMNAARSSPPPQMEDLKRLWPQVKLLFEEGGTWASLNSRLQILMLAVPDPGRKEKIRQILESHLQKLAAV